MGQSVYDAVHKEHIKWNLNALEKSIKMFAIGL